MCLNPIKIRSPAKLISRTGGQVLTMTVRCNKCAECVESIRQEWYLRTYYEVKNTLSNNGYVYFDTLTYAPQHLPMLSHFLDITKYSLSDFSCFNHKDFKLFLKRLRQLIYAHHKIRNAFKYFLTSEYGTDERFTHRPHYHIMFFVLCNIDPLTFSRYVSQSWQLGRTDGVPFQPNNYVLEHIYTNKTDINTALSASLYVSKYITKSSTFENELNKRIHALKLANVPNDTIKELRNNINMFHRQSQGFGLSYINNDDSRMKSLLIDDIAYIQDSDEIIHTQPLPMYYKRKLYCVQLQHEDKSRYWEYTEDGINHVYERKLKLIKKRVEKYETILLNSDYKLVDIILHLLGQRTFEDIAIYELFYKGRNRNMQNYDLINDKGNSLTNDEQNLYDWIEECKTTNYYNSENKSLQVFEKDNVEYVRVPVKESKYFTIHKSIPKKDYINRYQINQNTHYKFRNFDNILDLFRDMENYIKKGKQTTFDYIEQTKEKFKSLGLIK